MGRFKRLWYWFFPKKEEPKEPKEPEWVKDVEAGLEKSLIKMEGMAQNRHYMEYYTGSHMDGNWSDDNLIHTKMGRKPVIDN